MYVFTIFLLKGVVHLNYEQFIVRMHYIFARFVLKLSFCKINLGLKGLIAKCT